MARLGQTFDATQHDTEQSDFELLPTGIYQLEISASEVREDDDKNKTLSVTYDVIAPEQFKGRRIFAYIDLEHRDVKKQEDGQRDFAKLCRALSLNSVEDSDELHFIAFTAKVQNAPAGVSKAGRPYKAKNRVQKFFYPDQGNAPEPSIDEAQPPAANDNKPAAQQQASRPAAAGGARRPWGK